MSVPAELSLLRRNDQYRIRFRPVREIRDSFRLCGEYAPNNNSLILPLAGKPVLAEIVWKPGQEKTVTVGETGISAVAGSSGMLLLADRGIIEYWLDDGLVYGAVETDMEILSGRMEISSGTESVRVFEYCG